MLPRALLPGGRGSRAVVGACRRDGCPALRKPLEHEAAVLGRVERHHGPGVRTTPRGFLHVDLDVILGIAVLVHVLALAAVLVVPLAAHPPATFLIALGVVVALVVVVFADDGPAAAIFALVVVTLVVVVLCPCPGGGPRSQDQKHHGAQRN